MIVGDSSEGFSSLFLSRLNALNNIVAQSGASMASNLCYLGTASVDVGAKPDAFLAPLRRNFGRVTKFKRSMLEVGFNAGHSALLALSSNPSLSYFGIDSAANPYTVNCAEYLSNEFSGRFQILIADSREALPYLAISNGLKFELVHLDGGDSADLLRADVSNALRLVDPDGHIIINNIVEYGRENVFLEFVMTGLICSETLGNMWEPAGNVLLRPRMA